MRVIPTLAAFAISLSAIASTTRAQDSLHVITSAPIVQDEISTVHLVTGGVAGAFAGAGFGISAGVIAGAVGCRASGGARCELTYGLSGALAGFVIGAPIGVHVANQRRGNAAATVLGSVAATAALLALGSTLTRHNGAPFVLTLPFDIGAAVAIARHTSRD